MKALVYHGPGRIALENVPKAVVKTATDAVVRMTKKTCLVRPRDASLSSLKDRGGL